MDEKLIAVQTQNQVKRNFGGLEDEHSNFRRAKAVILQVPYEKTTTYKKGTGNGPAAIIDASMNMELFDEELNQETYRMGIHTANGLMLDDVPPEEMVEKVRVAVLECLKAGKFPVVLGGEHSITPGAVKAFKEVYENLSVLHMDAHYDMRDEYLGSKFNHACAARRTSEICPIVQVGVRSLSKEERDFLSAATAPIKTMDVYDILDRPFWKDEVSKALTDNVYVTIDLDVFDPSLVPAVGTPEPGGIGWYETLELLRSVSKDRKIVGFDVMELCPIPGQPASDFLAAKLVYRLLGYIFGNKR
jgi:agmatinase